MSRSYRSGADGVVAYDVNLACERPPRPLQTKWLRAIFLMSRPPLLTEEGNIAYLNQFVHTSPRLSAGDLQQLFRDVALTQLVVFERQVFDESVGVIRSVLHRYHAGALLTRLGIQQHLMNVDVEIVRQEITQDGLRVRFKAALRSVAHQPLFSFCSGDLQFFDFPNRQKLKRDWMLRQRVDELRR